MARILLAEDEMLLRELACEDLADAGFEVIAANNGEEALAILAQDREFDLLFTDIRMPGAVDGWQLAKEAKGLVPGLRVIYSTGLGDSEQQLEPEDRLLQKPYALSDLLRHMNDLLLLAGPTGSAQ